MAAVNTMRDDEESVILKTFPINGKGFSKPAFD
jgi:hypothetical protein